MMVNTMARVADVEKSYRFTANSVFSNISRAHFLIKKKRRGRKWNRDVDSAWPFSPHYKKQKANRIKLLLAFMHYIAGIGAISRTSILPSLAMWGQAVAIFVASSKLSAFIMR